MDLREALAALLDAAGETRARAILAEVARPSVLVEFERLTALRLVARMREQQVARYAIRDRLALRGFSRSAAYRLIEQAISAPPTNCPSEGPSVGRDSKMLRPEPSQPQEHDTHAS